ncbi:hypothetical protein ECH_0231 [Ehrlichia chaffeensis str. Arkansas]|uniref:Uncharacterized protein n=1 Tax=Ehrlichia chaffeensis (strain ATCC CRL-10679 / Arkansas) TaxID=205920 RepID=Q2GHN1_EHRCR|nr:hypothetical protein ECH_0231 [Ehrlichia chaffeensis str. Arkansas]
MVYHEFYVYFNIIYFTTKLFVNSKIGMSDYTD